MGQFSGIKSIKPQKVNGGVDKYHDPINIDNNSFRDASNIHIDGGKCYKRPGKKLWGPTFSQPFNGVTEYIDKNGTSRLLVASGDIVYEVDSSTKTSRDTEITNERIHFHTLRGKCFYNGDTTQRKIDETTASAVGLAKPTTEATVAAGVSTGLTGSYAVKVTYVIEVDSTKVYESDPSDASNSVTLANEDLALTEIPLSSDSRVNARYIYRTTADGSKYWYEGKISDNTTTTYTASQVDALLGDEVENNHGQPNQGDISIGCNEKQFWANGSVLESSESAITDSYVEYHRTLAIFQMRGKIKGLGTLYNENVGREDLYIFLKDQIYILPQGDNNQPLIKVRDNLGIIQHDTIAEYDGWLVFVSNHDTVCMIRGNTVRNISTRRISNGNETIDVLKSILDKTKCQGSIIFNHYYALTLRDNPGKLYNTTVWVCDLTTLIEIKPSMFDATWYPWDFNAQYLIQLSTGAVLMLDTNVRRIFQISLGEKVDQDENGNDVQIDSWIWTKNFSFNDIMSFKRPLLISLFGSFQRTIKITPYVYINDDKTEIELNPVESAFVAGQSVMGTPTTKMKDILEAALGDVVGNTFSFKIKSDTQDHFFELVEYQFTYIMYSRNI